MKIKIILKRKKSWKGWWKELNKIIIVSILKATWPKSKISGKASTL